MRLYPTLPRVPAVSEVQLGYFAGIIDGEGTIGASVQARQRGFGAYVTIGNTCLELLKYLESLMGGRLYQNSVRRIRCKQMYYLWWTGSDAIELCKKIEPYLFVKRAQASILADFPICAVGAMFAPGEELRQAVAFVQLKELNKRGFGEDQVDEPEPEEN